MPVPSRLFSCLHRGLVTALLLLMGALLAAGCRSAPAPTPVPITPTSPPTVAPAAMPMPTPTTAIPPTAIPTEAAAPTAAPLSIDETVEDETTDVLTQRLAALPELQNFSGVVLVARNGETLFSQGYGYADRQAQLPNTPQTRFRLGSLTKQFTAAAVLMLQDRGLLNVQDPICDYVDDCPPAWQPITIHHLLAHTSGIPDFTNFPDYAARKGQPSTLSQTLARFRDAPLEFAPGTSWNYSNSGYIVLGRIIEQASGQRYEDFLRAHIFEPLGMADSGYDHDDADLAVGYVNAGPAQADFLDMSIPHAAGALYGSAEDLLRWDRGLDAGLLLPAELQAQMFTAHAAIPDSGGFGYGYGWEVGEVLGRRVVSHMGGIEGFSVGITRVLDDHTLIVVLSNEEQTNPRAVSQAVLQALYAE